MNRVICPAALVIVAVCSSPCSARQIDAAVDQQIEQTCFECHQGDQPAGDLDLSTLSRDLDDEKTFARWELIHDRVASGEMPPQREALAAPQRGELVESLARQLHEADLAKVHAAGRGSLRRLTREEYESNLRDLLQLPHLDVRDLLPEDRIAESTNKVADVLDLTRVQLRGYLQAADVALRRAVASGIEPRRATEYRARATKMFPKAIDHGGRESSFFAIDSRMVPLTAKDLRELNERDAHDERMEIAIFRSAAWPYYGYPNRFVAKQAGRYQVRFAARAVRQLRDFRLTPSTRPHPMTFRARKPSQADVSGDVRATGGIIDIQPAEAEYQTNVLLKPGETIEYSLLGLPVPHPITSHGGPLYYDFPPMPEGGHPGIAFRWIEITGPHDSATWPPPSHKVLFGELPIKPVVETDESATGRRRLNVDVVSQNPREDAARLLQRFASAAARRELAPELLGDYQRLIFNRLDAGDPFAEAMLAGYKAILCSTHFLFLDEPRPSTAADRTRAPRAVAVASRLSHFLWNTRPDQTLLRKANSGRLLNEQENALKAETIRLIADDQFDAFIVNFTDYWLDLKELLRDDPDIRLYPEYRGDDYLTESMGWETREFVKALFRENLPVTTLVESDFAMLNDRLARHYELPPVVGSRVRKVSLPPDSPRGGLLTQAAILKVTANGTTTSPVIRGAWVMDRVFGQPPPPPPPDVPAVEPDLRGATTIRQILAAHAADETCANCHRRFDPVGLALENFDVMGGWRTRYRSLQQGDEITGIDRAGHKYSYRVAASIDTAGQTDDGHPFHGVDDLKRILSQDPRQLARNLIRRLLAYATGTPMRFSDRREIERILDDCHDAGYRAGDLMHGLIQSRLFVGGSVNE